jgi:NAD dependent epimerase/dehydratase family
MRAVFSRKAVALGALACVSGAIAVLAACSSSNSSNGNGFGNGNDASTNGEGSVSTQGCSNPTVPLVFSPMFSAYIPGSTAQTFQIPVITSDGNQATWSLSDPTQGNLATQTFDGAPGVMITISGTGDTNGNVTVYANESGGACGAAVLTITTNAENDWTIGDQRYNNGNNLHLPTFDGGGRPFGDGGIPEGGFPEGGFPHGDGGGGGGGGGGWLGERHNPETHLIPNVLAAATAGRPVDMFGTDYPTPDGTCVRDYIHVTDLADAHLRALDACEKGRHRIYNLGSQAGFSVREVIDLCREVTGIDVAVNETARRPGDPAVLVASSERIKAELGWSAARDLRAMAADAWQFVQARATR